MIAAFMMLATSATPAPPSEMARALAADAHPGAASSLETAKKGIESQLLNGAAAWRGMPCDKTDPHCQAAAAKIAGEFAPKIIAWARARNDYLAAIAIDRRMSTTDIKAAGTFLHTTAGQHFMAALNDLSDPHTAAPMASRVLFGGEGPTPPSSKDMFDRFYDLTVDLPRSTHMPLAPPPPTPSRSPKP